MFFLSIRANPLQSITRFTDLITIAQLSVVIEAVKAKLKPQLLTFEDK